MSLLLPPYKLPVVCRFGEKLKPANPQYQKVYEQTTKLALMTTFEKECLNFFYIYDHCMFSLSFSLAWNDDGFLKQEMEFEYEEHIDQKVAPSRNEVEEILENMFIELIPTFLHSRVHARTKYDFLLEGLYRINR